MIYTFNSKEQYMQAWDFAMRVGIEFSSVQADCMMVVPIHELVYVDDFFQQILNQG